MKLARMDCESVHDHKTYSTLMQLAVTFEGDTPQRYTVTLYSGSDPTLVAEALESLAAACRRGPPKRVSA